MTGYYWPGYEPVKGSDHIPLSVNQYSRVVGFGGEIISDTPCDWELVTVIPASHVSPVDCTVPDFTIFPVFALSDFFNINTLHLVLKTVPTVEML
jgi:hypothetical protein